MKLQARQQNKVMMTINKIMQSPGTFRLMGLIQPKDQQTKKWISNKKPTEILMFILKIKLLRSCSTKNSRTEIYLYM